MRQTVKFARRRIDKCGKRYYWRSYDWKNSTEELNVYVRRAGTYGYW